MTNDNKPVSMRERFNSWRDDLEARAIQHASNPATWDYLIAAVAVGYLVYAAVWE